MYFAFIQQQKQGKGNKTLSGGIREREQERESNTDLRKKALRDEILGEQNDRPVQS